MPDLTATLTVTDLHERTVTPVWHRVCGRRLMQMTFGQARFIEALELWNPTEPADLLLACFVCSRPAAKVRSQFDSRHLRSRLNLWRRWLGKRWDYEQSLAVWKRFVRYHLTEPYAVERPAGFQPKGAKAPARSPINTPWLSHLRAFLCGRMGYAPESFDDQPVGLLILDYFATLEIEGSVVLAKVTREQYMERRRIITEAK